MNRILSADVQTASVTGDEATYRGKRGSNRPIAIPALEALLGTLSASSRAALQQLASGRTLRLAKLGADHRCGMRFQSLLNLIGQLQNLDVVCNNDWAQAKTLCLRLSVVRRDLGPRRDQQNQIFTTPIGAGTPRRNTATGSYCGDR
jgi:hypothetical protein